MDGSSMFSQLSQHMSVPVTGHIVMQNSPFLPVFENTYFTFIFSDFKKHDFLRFFEMMYQKLVKSR